MVSPHFPPDASAAAHRVRLLAPHLPAHGWEPTVVTVDPRDYEGPVDDELTALVPPSLRVVRCRAWPARWTRAVGFGDLGLRAFTGLRRAARRLLSQERFDALFITTYPTYPALLGPVLARRYRVPFVLDYQDPWVGEWGRSVGPRADGRPDVRSRLARALARYLEPKAARGAAAITAVSEETYEQVRARHPGLATTPCLAVPLGGERADLEYLRRHPRANSCFDAGDGQVHVAAVGTLLPLAQATLRAALAALALVRDRRPDRYARLRLHFIGTSNQRRPDAPSRVRPVAAELGVADRVSEVAPRVDYLDALTAQVQAAALLLLGSSERHYTASRLYPALLAGRPVLAIYHEASPVVSALRGIGGPPGVRLVTFDGQGPLHAVDAIAAALDALAGEPVVAASPLREPALHEFSAESLAGRLAALFDGLRR
jgi:hypothetical protein